MQANLNQPASQILLDLIYANNGINLAWENIEFGIPVALPPTNDWSANTVLDVTAIYEDDDRYTGSTSITYRRIPLSELPSYGTDPLVVLGLPFQTTDLLTQINTFYQTQLSAADVVNVQYTELAPVVLQAAPGALCYVGEMTLPVLGDLSALVKTTSLGGFAAAG